jgi:hypothetical protein
MSEPKTRKKPAAVKSNAQTELPPPVLIPALAARKAAQERLQTATRALERAQRVAHDSEAAAERHAGARRAAEHAHAGAVESWIAGGCVGTRPERIVDQTLVDAEAAARAEHQASSVALASLHAAHDRARAELAEVEERMQSAVADILLAEALGVADAIVDLEQRAVDLRLELIGMIDHPLLRKQQATGAGLPQEISRALYRPTVSPGSGLYISRYADELLTSNSSGCASARQRWKQRVDELLNGPGSTDAAADEPQAA